MGSGGTCHECRRANCICRVDYAAENRRLRAELLRQEENAADAQADNYALVRGYTGQIEVMENRIAELEASLAKTEQQRLDAVQSSLRQTEDQLIKVADYLEAKCGQGLPVGSGDSLDDAILRKIVELERALAAEREACAKVAEDAAWTNPNTRMLGPEKNCLDIAAAIRARGETQREGGSC